MILTRIRLLAVVLSAQALVIAHPTPVTAQGTISPGQLTTGTVAPAGSSDTWTFSARMGDAIVARVGETSQLSGSFTPRVRILSPALAQLASSFGASAAEVALTAPTAGTYSIVVDDVAGTATGTYRLTLARSGSPIVVSPGDEGGAMTDGALHTGVIDVGDLDVWTIWAHVGEAMVVRMGEISPGIPLSPSLRLYSPDGALMSSSYSSAAAEVSGTAPSTGQYMVVAGDNSGGYAGSGGYRLTLAKTGSPVVVSGGDEGGPMTNGVMHTGAITVGDLDLWTTQAGVGEAIVVRVGEISPGSPLSPALRIYGPDGALLDSQYSSAAAEVAVTASTAGTYLVVVSDNSGGYTGSGAYRLTLAKTGSPVVVSGGDEGGPMTNGVMHTGTIDVGDLDVWTVQASIGQAIIARMGETASGSPLSPYLRIYDPNGMLLKYDYSSAAAEVAVNAPSTGTYLVVAADNSGGFTGSGAYQLTLARTGSPVVVSGGDEGGPMTNGVMHTGAITVGDLDLWTVSAGIGEALVVRMGETAPGSPLSPYLRIYDPNGTLLKYDYSSAAAEVAVNAPSTGTYLVVAADNSGGFTGSGAYRLTLAKTRGDVLVSAGDEGGPLTVGPTYQGIVDVGDLDVWTVPANVTDSLVVTMQEVAAGSPLSPYVRIYDPAGELVKYGYSSAVVQVPAVAPATGTYLVVVGDNSGGYTGSGAYRLTLGRNGGALVGADGPPAARAFAFDAPWPNPAHGMTNLEFQIPARAMVRVEVLDSAGRRVAAIKESFMDAGPQHLRWDGRDAAGNQVASGVYLARVATGANVATRRIVLVK